jgi:hypothetical protein
MIDIKLEVTNFFSDRFETIGYYSYVFTKKHKALEIQAMKTNEILVGRFSLKFRCDHAGVKLYLGLFGYAVDFHCYDTRHWDYEKKQFRVYNQVDK